MEQVNTIFKLSHTFYSKKKKRKKKKNSKETKYGQEKGVETTQ